MAQLNDITFDDNGRVLFVHNRVCLKSDCRSTTLYKKTILLKSLEEQRYLKKQILVPSSLFSQFETKSTGEKLVADEYSEKVALCFQHLTNQTQQFYLKNKILPDWAQIKQHPAKVGKIHSKNAEKGQKSFWFGHKYNRKALYRHNLFELSQRADITPQPTSSIPTAPLLVSSTSSLETQQIEGKITIKICKINIFGD